MKRLIVLLSVFLLLLSSPVYGFKLKAGTVINWGTSVPAKCNPGGLFIDTDDVVLYKCTSTDNWENIAVAEVYSSSWNASEQCPQKNDLYDNLHVGDTDDDGKADNLGQLTTQLLHKAMSTFVANDLTPDVSGGNFFKTNNDTSVRTITMFDGGSSGKKIYVLVDDAFTKFDFSGTNLIGNHGVDYTASSGDFLEAFFDGTNWYCFLHGNTLPVTGISDVVYFYDGDAVTKKMRFDNSLISAGQTRAMTVPDMDINLFGKDSDHDIWQAIAIDASVFISDSTNCLDAAEQTLNSGPKIYIVDCSDAAGTFEFKIPSMPENWDGGSILVELVVISDEATPAGTIEFDISIQARGNDETVNNTWVTTNGEVYFEDAETSNTTVDTQWDTFHCKNKTAMAASGAGSDSLFIKLTRDNDDGTHDTSTQGIWIKGVTVYYQIDDMDGKD